VGKIFGKSYTRQRERWCESIDSDKNNVRWSYSRATCFGHCKYEYYLSYIIRDNDLYLSESNYYAEIGSYVHEILALIFSGELAAKNAYKYFKKNYDTHVFYTAKQSTMDKTNSAIEEYFKNINLDWLDQFEILGVELEVNFKVGDHDFIGFIDLLLRDKQSGKIVVLDHKSSEYPFKLNGEVKKKSESSFNSYKRQMYLYCHAVNQLYGEFPDRIIWNHFKDGGKLAEIPFKESEYQETLKWFLNTVSEINSEENFEPNEDFFYCSNLCNFRNSCEYRELSKKKREKNV